MPVTVVIVGVIFLIFSPVLGASGDSTTGTLSEYVGSYVSHESNRTYRLDVALISGHLLFVDRDPSEHFAQCWIAHPYGKGLRAINGVAADYRKYSSGLFPTDFFGELSMESSGILDVEHNPGEPDDITHWKRISRTPDSATIKRICGSVAFSATR